MIHRFKRGDTYPLEIPFIRGGQAVNLTGALSIKLTAKRRLNDALPTIQKTLAAGGIVVTSAEGGLALATIQPADTLDFTQQERLMYDVELVEASGRVSTTEGPGVLIVDMDVS